MGSITQGFSKLGEGLGKRSFRKRHGGKSRDEIEEERLLKLKSKLKIEEAQAEEDAKIAKLKSRAKNVTDNIRSRLTPQAADTLEASISSGIDIDKATKQAFELDETIRGQASQRLLNRKQLAEEAGFSPIVTPETKSDIALVTDTDTADVVSHRGLQAFLRNKELQNRADFAEQQQRFGIGAKSTAAFGAVTRREQGGRKLSLAEQKEETRKIESERDFNEKTRQFNEEFGQSIDEFAQTHALKKEELQLNRDKLNQTIWKSKEEKQQAELKQKLDEDKMHLQYQKLYQANVKQAGKAVPFTGIFNSKKDPEAIAAMKASTELGAVDFANRMMGIKSKPKKQKKFTTEQEQLIKENVEAHGASRERVIEALRTKGLL